MVVQQVIKFNRIETFYAFRRDLIVSCTVLFLFGSVCYILKIIIIEASVFDANDLPVWGRGRMTRARATTRVPICVVDVNDLPVCIRGRTTRARATPATTRAPTPSPLPLPRLQPRHPLLHSTDSSSLTVSLLYSAPYKFTHHNCQTIW